MKLFEELAGDGPTFLLESFAHKLDRICKHVAHRVMEREGEWTREGVEKSTRVPRDQVESLQAQPKGDGEMPLDAHVVDARAQEALEQVELSDLYDLIRKLPDDQKQILIDRFYRDRAQQETAADLGVTDRTIRNRLVTILRDLRARYQGGEEVTHD